MEGFNAPRAGNYGATGNGPPPPYAGFASPREQPTGWPLEDANAARTPWMLKLIAYLKTRSFLALLTFITTVGLCMTAMPVTYCNDPVDPQVRERIREEWSKELFVHEKQVAEREIVKAQWAWEDERHAELLREWEQELARHARELKERARREEEERIRLGMFWGHKEVHQCTTYATRAYTAVLMNIPATWGRRVEACKATPLEIHGIARFPTNCEDKGHGVVIGHWEVNENEPDCNTYWGWYKDKGSCLLPQQTGCTSRESGKRRIEHYLENLPKGGDWREFCATTPARFHGMEFSGAQECYQYNSGAYGLWEIDDNRC